MEYKGDGDTSHKWCSLYNPQMIGKGTGGHGNKMTNRDHPDYSIIRIGQITEKSLGDMKKFAVNQNLVKNHQRHRVKKSQKSKIIILIKTKRLIT